MIQTKRASVNDIALIQDIAVKTWTITYADIISKEQIDYMLDMMYSDISLNQQMTTLKHHFELVKQSKSDTFGGFVSFEFDYHNSNTTKLHKLYVLPQLQGCGLGRMLINLVCLNAKEHGNESVLLNMNRNNSALGFYKNIGFEIIGEEDIDIGNGYLMEDYVFEKKI